MNREVMKTSMIMAFMIVIAMTMQSTQSVITTDQLCGVGECIEANLLCLRNGELSVKAEIDGTVRIDTESLINDLIEARPTLHIVDAILSPDTFSCKSTNSIKALINVTDDLGNCFIQEIVTTVNDTIAPVINCPPEIHVPVIACDSIFGALCYLNVFDLIPEVEVTDNCMEGSVTVTGTLENALDLVGDLLHLPLLSLGSYNVSFSYTDESGNSACVYTRVYIEGIQIINPLPFSIYLLNSLIKTTLSITFNVFSEVDSTAQLYLRAASSGAVGIISEIDSYIHVGVYELNSALKVSSDVLLDVLDGHPPGSYYLSLYLPECGCFSVGDPIVTFVF